MTTFTDETPPTPRERVQEALEILKSRLDSDSTLGLTSDLEDAAWEINQATADLELRTEW